MSNEPSTAASDDTIRPSRENALPAETARESQEIIPWRGRKFGRFLIIRSLRGGGCASVHVVLNEENGEPRALKVLSRRLGDQDYFAQRENMRRESDVMRKISHPHLVRYISDGEYCGIPYIEMELLQGPALDTILRAQSPTQRFPPRKILGWIRPICGALAKLHDHGVIHRDVKPSNIVIDDVLGPVLLDFGVAYVPETLTDIPSPIGEVEGTLSYFSPEQARGDDASPQMDIFSLAATIARATHNQCPYGEDSANVMVERAMHGEIITLPSRPDLPNELTRFLNRGMHPDPSQRPKDMAEFMKELDRVIVACEEHENLLAHNLIPMGAVLCYFGAAFIIGGVLGYLFA